jgi:coproporphyrinogen III oxidase-like Fe-S oxidoreductase
MANSYEIPKSTPSFGMETEAHGSSANTLANIDQLPVYGSSPPGQGIHADELQKLVANGIAGEANRQLLLYIHVPFCKYKCSFCDWVADIPTPLLTAGEDTRQAYVNAMSRQMTALGPKLMSLDYRPRYIYWGGGTPSRLDAPHFRQIVDALKRSVDLTRVEEHVMEVTPDSLTAEKLAAMKEVGVSRISMGVQSFDAGELKRSGRGHSPEQADEAVEMMRAAGFHNFNLDFIVAFPGQSLDTLRETLRRAAGHRPKHITAYLYRPTPSTTMARKRKDDSSLAERTRHLSDCYGLTKQMLEERGYREYALGYFSLETNDRCAGEMYYFHLQGDWMGFGGGAVSVLGHHRLKNSHAQLHQFIENPLRFDACEYLPERQVEAAIYSLRQALATEEGVNFENFRRFFGFEFQQVRKHPAVRAYLSYYRYCGAVFDETTERLTITRESRAHAYINVWSKAKMPASTAAALNQRQS